MSVNRILCCRLGAEPFLEHVFPDAVVVCGTRPAVVPYVAPGFALATSVQAEATTGVSTVGPLSCCSWSTTGL